MKLLPHDLLQWIRPRSFLSIDFGPHTNSFGRPTLKRLWPHEHATLVAQEPHSVVFLMNPASPNWDSGRLTQPWFRPTLKRDSGQHTCFRPFWNLIRTFSSRIRPHPTVISTNTQPRFRPTLMNPTSPNRDFGHTHESVTAAAQELAMEVAHSLSLSLFVCVGL